MSDNYKGEDIEKLIFRDGLSSAEIEPSEKFWNKAFEGILQRENMARSNSIARWKAATFFMGGILVLFTFYSVYTHRQINDLSQKVTQIEGSKVITIQHSVQQTNTIASEKKELKVLASQNNSQVTPQENITTTAASTKTALSTFPSNIKEHHFISKIKTAKSPYSSLVMSTQKTGVTNISRSVVNTQAREENNSSPVENKTTTAENLTQTNNSLIANSPAQKQEESPSTNIANANQPLVVQQHTSSTLVKNIDTSGAPSIADTLNSAYSPKNPITFSNIFSKSSISIFFAPGSTEDFLNDHDNDPSDNITENSVKSMQEGSKTFAFGLHLGYDISNKWTIQTGCSYRLYSYSIKPNIIYAGQQENGQVGYSIVTSSGTVFLPHSGGTTKLGDSIKVKGKLSRGYLSIPLQVKYNFSTAHRLAFYITGGVSANIAENKQTDIHWENNSFQEGDLTVKDIYGLNTIQYSYNFGLGANFTIHRGLSIFAEPYVDGAFTSINKNTPVITYPYFFGLALGLTYHF